MQFSLKNSLYIHAQNNPLFLFLLSPQSSQTKKPLSRHFLLETIISPFCHFLHFPRRGSYFDNDDDVKANHVIKTD